MGPVSSCLLGLCFARCMFPVALIAFLVRSQTGEIFTIRPKSVLRAQTNLLPFPYHLSNFEGSRAHDEFCARQKVASEKRERVTQGDRFGLKSCLVDHHQGSVFPGFKSLFQGDHLGVEFALASHEQLLVDEGNDEGLLHPACRLLGHHPVPDGCRLEGLIIDDYFAIGVEPIGTRPEVSFAVAALTRAREA